MLIAFAAVPKLAAQFIVVVPQPDVTATPATPLFEALTASGPVPDTVKEIGGIAALSSTLSVATEVIEMVGGVGFVTVMGICCDWLLLARSVTVTWTLVVPDKPSAGVSVRVQVVVGFPHVVGEIEIPAELLGIRADGKAETVRIPVPPMVKGNAGELLPPTMVVACNPVMAGAGICASAPSASTRP